MEDFNKYTSHINYSPIVDFVLQQGKQTYYKKGEYFSRQGEVCKTMGFVSSGSFRYCCTNSAGENSIVGYTFDHSFVGNYPAFQLQDKSNVDIQALCDCSVYVINYQQMTEFYDTNDAHQKLGRRIAETLLKIRKTKKPFFQNENGKSGRGKPKTKTSSFPTHAQK